MNKEINTINLNDLKIGDIYIWKYNSKFLKDLGNSIHSFTMHCKDGYAIFDGKLADTYWSSDRYILTQERVNKGQYTLKYVGNLEGYTELDSKYMYEQALRDYLSEDLLLLFIHGGYRNRYFLKKGAKKNISTQVQALEDSIKKEKYKKELAEQNIKEYQEQLNKIKGENND